MSWDGASAELSIATLNARASPKKTVLARNSGPEGPCLESTSLSFSSTPHNERSGDSNSLLCEEAPPEKDEKKDISISDMKLEDKSSKTTAVIEAMTMTVHEKTKLEKSTDDSSYKERIVQEPVITARIQELSVDGQSEHGEAKNTSQDSVQKQSGTMKAVLQSSKSSSCKHLSSAQFKEKVKAVPPHYLGTLKVLEDKHLQKNSTEFDKADSLRAAVFQNWMEKKRTFLLELKRTEKKNAEELRNDAEKKEAVKREEANASFKTWKAMKAKEAKKLNEKKKLEKLKEKEAAEQNAERAEAAQKMAAEGQSDKKASDVEVCMMQRNGKKKECMKQKKAEKILERRKKEIQQAKKDEKDKMAREEYERWLGNIKRREQLKKQQKSLQAVHRNEVSFPWIPPGKVTYTKSY